MSIYFIQISDTHLGGSAEFELYGCNTYTYTQQLIKRLNSLTTPLDFIIHTGDVVNDPDDQAGYQLAAELFAQLDIPIYYVNGNHDRAHNIKKYLPMAARTPLIVDKLCYQFNCKGERFIVLDGQVEDDALAPRGFVSEEQLLMLEGLLSAETTPTTVFIHFPAHVLDVPWMDQDGYMRLINGDTFHAALLPHRANLRAVFHGHLHRPLQLIKDGITYFAGPSAFSHFSSFSDTQSPLPDPHTSPSFNYIQLLNNHLIVQTHGV